MLASMLTVVAVYSQTMTLRFVGHGRGGIQEEETYQQIDSLLVHNVTRQWSRMIYYPDTVVIMNVSDVPVINVKTAGLEQNVPNPFDCVTDVELNLSHDDDVTLAVVDISGRECIRYSGNLPAGSHMFEITLSVPQTYFLTAVTSDAKYTIKMVNTGSCGGDKIMLKSSSAEGISQKSFIDGVFELGDQMDYYAYTTYNGLVFTASDFRSQVNSEDITLLFLIPYCTRTMNIGYEYGCESFTWINGVTYYETDHNAARMNLISAGGCDSIVFLDITIDHPVQTEDYIIACEPINWHGQTCATTGTYTANLQSHGGCDSIVTLHFTRQNRITNDIYESGCGDFVWNGMICDETGVYEQTFPGSYGCDSVVYLHYTNLTNYVVDVVNACDSYTWNGRNYFSSNNTDTVHLTNIYGCDSIVALNLTMSYSHSNVINATACRQYEYNGTVYTQSGSYDQHLTTANGCDSIVTLNITITQSVEEDIYESACESYSFGGNTYTQSNVYDIHYTTPTGCDSIIHLHLDIYHGSSSSETVVACDSYQWNGTVYTESGTYHETLYTTHGCDSVLTLYLTIKHSVSNEVTINACRSYDLNGEIITVSDDYVRTYVAANGCDSVVTYHINILDNVETEFTEYACGSYTWDGTTYTQTGNYDKHYSSFVGCDSTVTLHLFIGEANYDITDFQTACGSYEWEGDTYSVGGTYTKTLQNRYHCDSVVTLQLTINPTYNLTVSQVACDSYEWEGDTYTTSGSYPKTLHTQLGCDSIVTLNLTIKYGSQHEIYDTTCGDYLWDGRTYSASGDFPYTYTAANGCDSVVTLHLVYHELVTDARDGNTYCTMEYGDQVWMTENMRYLPQVDNTASVNDPKYYVYGYTGSNVLAAMNRPEYNNYGALYNFAAAQTACPTGWHLPTKDEWDALVDYLGTQPEFICSGISSNVAKALASQDLWSSNAGECTVGYMPEDNNASGFNGKPGGYYSGSNFLNVGGEANWWTSTQSSTSGQRYVIQSTSVGPDSGLKSQRWAFSVRCVKN